MEIYKSRKKCRKYEVFELISTKISLVSLFEYHVPRSISKGDACQHLSPLIIAMSLSLNHPFLLVFLLL